MLLVVIDAASPRVLCPAVQTGRLANLKRLADAGEMHQSSVTIFPSITPAATSTIITGTYPSEHGIAGAAWYDEPSETVAYYGDDFWVVAKEGFGHFLRDFLVRLNGDRLKAPTLFEMVERSGRSAGSLNYLVHRGLMTHRAHVPAALAVLPGVPLVETVEGPSTFVLGDFVTTVTQTRRPSHPSGLLHRFGMDDDSTGELLAQLVADRALPDFTVAYFADNDFRSHEVGPVAALPALEGVDRALGAAFDAAGGFERFMRDTCVIVTSDHGHCDILADADRAVVRLDQILGEFTQGSPGGRWRKEDDILICPNMRAAQIYLREPSPQAIHLVARKALADPRVEMAIWAESSGGGPTVYWVVSGRGTLRFWRDAGGADGDEAVDAYGTRWRLQGEPTVLQLERDGQCVQSTEFPNAFERICGVLDARNSGHLWVTAAPGCEFELPGGAAHVGGGSHGALHALDSLSPVIAAGLPRRLPRAMRSVDLAPLCMLALGSSMRYGVGDPR